MSFLGLIDLSTSRESELSQDAFEFLRKVIYNETGIFFPDNKKYLMASRLEQRVSACGLNNFTTYISRLKNGTLQAELPQLINAITINETFFFRNDTQLAALETDILPNVLANRQQSAGRTVKIWSAACSSGEEPYTLAIIIREKIQPLYPQFHFEIIGTDIDINVLNTARKGLYREYAIRKLPAAYLQKYFRQQDDFHALHPDIMNMVHFRQLNLFDNSQVPLMNNFDIIICANALIYFDLESKRKVVGSLYNSLRRGGYLLLGYSESLYGLSQAFKPVHLGRTIAYNKE